jgi:uncharacterized protein with PCYCGC motif
MKKLLLVLIVLGVAAFTWAQFTAPQGEVPAFHKTPPAKSETLPPVLTEKQLAANGIDHPAAVAAYKAAAKAPNVMYQQPCYCYCDRNHGHKSLHSCFEDMHGANCGTCVQEALYSYKMSKKGWTPSQIRAGIIRGEFKQIDLSNPEPVK